MKFNLVKPCEHCPFRIDCLKGWLGKERAAEIVNAMIVQDKTFSCHKTTEESEDGSDRVDTDNTQHCARALILLESLERPNQLMRIAERLGMYDYTQLKNQELVFKTANEFIKHHS